MQLVDVRLSAAINTLTFDVLGDASCNYRALLSGCTLAVPTGSFRHATKQEDFMGMCFFTPHMCVGTNNSIGVLDCCEKL